MARIEQKLSSSSMSHLTARARRRRFADTPAGRLRREHGVAWLFLWLTIVVASQHPSPADAQTYAVGQRLECDGTGLKKYYEPGTVIPYHSRETFNGYLPESGYFYRVRIDGRASEGILCKAEDTRPIQDASQQGAAPDRLVAQKESSAAQPRFGTRSPLTCPPVRSRPSSDQIIALLRCDFENKTRDLIYLYENVSVQAGGTRAYSEYNDGGVTDIDTSAPVLPIRLSVDEYQCAALSRYTNVGSAYDTDNTGKNCTISPYRQTTGACYLTTFGDWHCYVKESIDTSLKVLNQPPLP